MPRRKLPSPVEYGRQLAEARRTREKARQEAQERTDNSFRLVLEQLEQYMGSLEALKALVNDLDRDVLSPGTFQQATDDVFSKLTDIENTIAGLNLEVPAPVVQEFPAEALDGVLSELRRLPETLKQPSTPSVVSPPPAETIFAGPVTLKVSSRDGNGDISEVQVEPTRH